ncbi:hypothetical protein [Halorubellus sp. PRR65]|uniref:DUF7537 family lipoprotein n=1 Tax=Halorubellus sp. PRR65 TaxID=3098148 RepID=UPI002B25ED83|nr:hypothetical protein [Halorubellus sp. PRR65]
MTRRLATVLVVALVVLAGCSGGPGTSTAPGDRTDASTDDPTATDGDRNRVTVPSNLIAPGASQRGIASPRTLLRAHARALSNVSTSSSTRYTALGANATGTVEYALTHAAGGDYVSSRRSVGNGTTTGTDVYFAGGTVTTRSVQPNGTTYEYAVGPTRTRFQYTRPSRPFASASLLYFSLSDGLRASDFGTRNGQKVVEYESTGVNESRFRQYRGALGVPNATVEDLSFTVFVAADGVVHDADATLTVETGAGDTEEFVLDHAVESYGEASVATPSWRDEAVRVNGSLVANGTAVELENVGSATLFDHSVGVAGNVTRSTSVNESLAPGETRYVYVTTTGNETTVHVTDDRSTVPAAAQSIPKRTSASVFLGSPNVSISIGLTADAMTGNATVDHRDTRSRPTARTGVTPTSTSTLDTRARR